MFVYESSHRLCCLQPKCEQHDEKFAPFFIFLFFNISCNVFHIRRAESAEKLSHLSSLPLKGQIQCHRGFSWLCYRPVNHFTLVLSHVLLVHLRHLRGACFKPRHSVGYVNHVNLISPIFTEDAAEHFLEALAKVLGHQSVHDGVDTRVGVGHAVREKPEGIRGLIERKVSIQVAQDHHMVRQPAYAEKHGDNDDHFGDFAFGPLGF